MRFDLELDVVSSLTTYELNKIALTLYDQDDTTITPAVYDHKTLFKKAALNKGNINTSRFNNFANAAMDKFPSYIAKDGLEINDVIRYNSLAYPVLNGGEFTSANKSFTWSNLSVNIPCEYNDTYTCDLTGDPDLNSVSVFTLALKSPGYIDKVRVFKYIALSDTLQNTFKNTLENNLYTIDGSRVILNRRTISYTDIFIGKGNGLIKSFALPEFPAYQISIRGYDSSEYSVVNGAIIFNTSPVDNEDISISYTVLPIVSYQRNILRDDHVYMPYNINPATAGKENGVVCLYNSYSNLNSPSSIDVSSSLINELNNIYKISARLKNTAGIPITNKQVTFNVVEDGVLFGATNSKKYIATTSMNGAASVIAFGDYSNLGLYIQKEWVSGDTISIPGDINIKNNSDVFLYLITDYDPILGKTNSEPYEVGITENYKNDDITSYYISGRKVAHIELVGTGSAMESRYIKPIAITKAKNTHITFRNLNIDGTNETILRTRIGQTTYEDTATQLKYKDQIPVTSDSILGYYIVFNKEVPVNVTYEDEYTNLKSETLVLNIKNIKSETPFTISREAIPYRNTTLGDIGYFSVSDYLNNGYGLYPTAYGCIHSDVIGKKCIHANKAYHGFYSLDSNNLFCTHTPEGDALLPQGQRCPGVEANLVNPFPITTPNPTI